MKIPDLNEWIIFRGVCAFNGFSVFLSVGKNDSKTLFVDANIF